RCSDKGRVIDALLRLQHVFDEEISLLGLLRGADRYPPSIFAATHAGRSLAVAPLLTKRPDDNRRLLLSRTLARRAVGARLHEHRKNGLRVRAHGRVRLGLYRTG